MSKKILKPDFFIVGAPKCGTTSMHNYLRQHPEIFMPELKEIHHFADDLLRPDDPFLDRERYLLLFKDAKEYQVIGETSVFYLLSANAAKNIKSFNPNAKIIIMLRNPIDVIYSLHSQLVFNGEEDIKDFKEALKVEALRREGKRLPKNTRFIKKHFYSEVVRYTEQLERYFNTFDKESIFIILFEQFKDDFVNTYNEVLKFLNVNTDFRPIFKIYNANKIIRYRLLDRFIKNPPLLFVIFSKVIPLSFKIKFIKMVERMNTKYVPRPEMPEDLRRELQDKLKPEIEQLSDFLNKDLSRWLEN